MALTLYPLPITPYPLPLTRYPLPVTPRLPFPLELLSLMPTLASTLSLIGPPDAGARERAQRRLDDLTKPRGSLGRLEEIVVRLAGITHQPVPTVTRKHIVVMAADHGVAAEGVSAYPQEVTAQMVANFAAGGAGINVLGRWSGATVHIVDMGVAVPSPELVKAGKVLDRRVGPGTKNFAREPAMTREQALQAVEAGIGVAEGIVAKGCDAFAIGDMGIGNTTSASAIAAALTGNRPAEVTGYGTGISDAALNEKCRVIAGALSLHKPNPSDALDVLRCVGGFEIAGLAGVCLGAAAARLPVLLDGFIATAGAAIAAGLSPRAVDCMIAAHASPERGHRILLERLGQRPLLDLQMRLGEGTGAALGLALCEAACRCQAEMATFAGAGVSEKL